MCVVRAQRSTPALDSMPMSSFTFWPSIVILGLAASSVREALSPALLLLENSQQVSVCTLACGFLTRSAE